MSRSVDSTLVALMATHPAIQRSAGSAEELRELLDPIGLRLPLWYERLVLNYSWDEDALAMHGVRFLPRPHGISVRPWFDHVMRDRGLAEVLLRAGYLPFAQPDTGHYDPICFDTRRIRGRDCPIVQLDHEAALVHSQTRVVEELFPSSRALFQTGST